MKHVRAWILPLLLGVLILPGCEDDSTDPGGGGGTTAPRILTFEPDDEDTRVLVGETIEVTFSEAMDQTVASSVVTLSEGGPATLTWVNSTTLEIDHSDWTGGTEVTVTLGTGLVDVDGNGLTEALSWTFWTESPIVELLATDPPDGATDVIRNGQVRMLFSRDMDLGSLDGAMQVETPDPPKAPVDFSLESGDREWVIMSFDSDLPASTPIDITISNNAFSTQEEPLAAEENFGFTTGLNTDTTPPTIVAVEPANGSSFSGDAPYIRFTFSESIEPDSFSPSFMSAQLWVLTRVYDLDVVLSDDNTVLTVPLPGGLPAGLRLVAHFVEFEDLAGNAQTTPYEYDVTVSGTADFWPFIDQAAYAYEEFGVEGDITGPISTFSDGDLVRMEEQSNGDFFLASYDDFSFTALTDTETFRRGATQIIFKGFAEYDGLDVEEFDLTPDVQWIKLPFAAENWSGSTSAPAEGGTATINYSVETMLNQDIDSGFPIDDGGKTRSIRWRGESVESEVDWVGCYMHELQFEFVIDSEIDQTGRDIRWYVAGIGLVRYSTIETDADGNYSEVEAYVREFEIPGFVEAAR